MSDGDARLAQREVNGSMLFLLVVGVLLVAWLGVLAQRETSRAIRDRDEEV